MFGSNTIPTFQRQQSKKSFTIPISPHDHGYMQLYAIATFPFTNSTFPYFYAKYTNLNLTGLKYLYSYLLRSKYLAKQLSTFGFKPAVFLPSCLHQKKTRYTCGGIEIKFPLRSQCLYIMKLSIECGNYLDLMINLSL